MARRGPACLAATKLTWLDAAGKEIRHEYVACALAPDPPHDTHQAAWNGRNLRWTKGVDFTYREGW